MTTTERDPAMIACLRRTRTAVLVVLAIAAGLIAAGLAFLRTRPAWVPLAPEISSQWFRGGLFGVLILSYAVRRVVAHRRAFAIRPPARPAFISAMSPAQSSARSRPRWAWRTRFSCSPTPTNWPPSGSSCWPPTRWRFPGAMRLDDFDEPMPRPDASSGGAKS